MTVRSTPACATKRVASTTSPGTTRRRVAAETLRDWLYAYRRAGFDGLKPRPRADQGHARALPQAVADQLCALKEAHPTYSVTLIIATARAQQRVPADVPLAPATVHRLFSRHGLMARPTDAPTSKDRRRFSYDAANELWMSDVMHGPTVLDPEDRRRHRTFLIALLDDATRLIPYAAFTRRETVTDFLPVFERALLRRGVPKRLYVDNGSAYRARHLALVCAKLGVTLIHARPFAPQGKGKLERWFRTVRLQLLPTLLDTDTRVARRAQSAAVDLDRGRISRHAAPRPAGRDAARALGPRGPPRHPPHAGSDRPLSLRGEAQGPPRSHRQSPRRRLRGRRRARRPDRHAPL